jgi:arylsulfatase A-like enzyme
MVTVHGDRCGGHYRQWFRETAPDWQTLHDDTNELPHNYSCPQAYRTPIPEDLYPTAYIRDRSRDFLKSQSDSGQPFFLFVSFPDPHHPFNPPGKYWDMYGPDQFEVGLPFDAHQNPTPPMQWLEDQRRNGGGQMTPQTAMMLDDQRLREAMALTAGMITMVDDAIGSVMETLRETGLLDNTVVSFNSDHGDYLGDFNMLLKGALPFRSITRVPFIWSDPASRRARSTDALASTVDIGQTVLARAGLKPYFGVQGESLLDAAQGGTTARDDLLIEYNDGGARLGFAKPSRVRALLTDRYRITIYRDQDWGELYDLAEDPNETCNLWDDPTHAEIKLDLSLRLNHRLTAMMDESPRSQRIA